jgi:hypothetical protein
MLGIDGRTRSLNRSGGSRGGLVLGRLSEWHYGSSSGGTLEGVARGREGSLVCSVLLEL